MKPLPINTAAPATRQPIYNSLTSASLDAIAITDRSVFEVVASKTTSVYTQSLADQMNAQRTAVSPPMSCLDLVDFIADVTIETSIQGSGVLTVSVIDPAWELLKTQANGSSFISVDPYGYLWPPIEVNFPVDESDALWRLCGVKADTTTSSANLSLIFEDAIVSELREHDQYTDPSCAQSYVNETRAEYIRRCIKTASRNPQDPSDVGIRFIPLLPNSVFTEADLYGDTTSVPTSALVTGRNFLKKAQGYNKIHKSVPGVGVLTNAEPITGDIKVHDTLWPTTISIGSGTFGVKGS